MDQLSRFSRSTRIYTYWVLVVEGSIVLIGGWALHRYVTQDFGLVLLGMAALAFLLPISLVWLIDSLYVRPLRILWQAILFVAPQGSGVPAPDMSETGQANELVRGLVNHVYQLADMSHALTKHATADASEVSIEARALQQLPLPVIALGSDGTLRLINDAALAYLQAERDKAIGQPLGALLDVSFKSEHTLDTWLTRVRGSEVRAGEGWERVRLTTPAEPANVHLVDVAASYFKEDPSGIETILVIADHTATYGADDQALGFVTMAVHEMRTPLTALRGYIEALHDELGASVTGEIATDLQRAEASGQRLAAFVNNVLNVSRVEDGQLVLQLAEEQWKPVVEQVVSDYQLRAQTRGITLAAKVADGLPTVGVDRVSIYQVVANLIENAIKYSPAGSEVVIEAHLGKDGRVETLVKDHGPGIVASAIPQLFDKFYRDHRNKNRVSGTGLGLYLSKTFVNAHGGEIWVNSKEGQGSEFGFSLPPYSQLAAEQKDGNNKGITRTAHGWIKNHSIYRG